MNTITYTGAARIWSRTDNIEKRKIDMNGTKNTDLPLGDGNASVSSTRGFKQWFSTREEGLTIESTVSVTMHCNQDSESIQTASETSSNMAEHLAAIGMQEMGVHLNSFKDHQDPRYELIKKQNQIPVTKDLYIHKSEQLTGLNQTPTAPEPIRKSEKIRRYPK